MCFQKCPFSRTPFLTVLISHICFWAAVCHIVRDGLWSHMQPNTGLALACSFVWLWKNYTASLCLGFIIKCSSNSTYFRWLNHSVRQSLWSLRINGPYWKVDGSSPGSPNGVGLGEEKRYTRVPATKQTNNNNNYNNKEPAWPELAWGQEEAWQVNSAGRVLAICELEWGVPTAEGTRSYMTRDKASGNSKRSSEPLLTTDSITLTWLTWRRHFSSSSKAQNWVLDCHCHFVYQGLCSKEEGDDFWVLGCFRFYSSTVCPLLIILDVFNMNGFTWYHCFCPQGYWKGERIKFETCASSIFKISQKWPS